MKTNKTKIQNNYFDALFFANATSTEKLPFHISPAEFKLLIKLVHYHNDQINITWTSENISKHISMSVGVIDKSIQRLKQKGYVNTSTYNTDTYIKHRTIFINWKKIEEVNELYLQSILNQSQTQNKTPQLTIISQPIPEVQIDKIVSEIKEKDFMRVKFESEMKYSKDSPISPAQFHTLTNDYFLDKLPYKNFTGLKSNDFEGFWNRIQELKNKINQNELV